LYRTPKLAARLKVALRNLCQNDSPLRLIDGKHKAIQKIGTSESLINPKTVRFWLSGNSIDTDDVDRFDVLDEQVAPTSTGLVQVLAQVAIRLGARDHSPVKLSDVASPVRLLEVAVVHVRGFTHVLNLSRIIVARLRGGRPSFVGIVSTRPGEADWHLYS
jgi:hypothetical protein